MRAQLWLEQESHWKLTSRDDEACHFRFGPAVRFFFPNLPPRSYKIDRVLCERMRTKTEDGKEIELQRMVLFLGNKMEVTFTVPSGCVWVAGEVEL